MIDDPNAEGVLPDDPLNPRRKSRVAGSDPLLDELMAENGASPSAPSLPSVAPPPTSPVATTNTAATPPSPYLSAPSAAKGGSGETLVNNSTNNAVVAPTDTGTPSAAARPASSYMVEGLDMGKLTSGEGVTPKYQFWRAMQSGVPYEQAVAQIGGQVIDGERFMLNGTVVDITRDVEGDAAAQWLELGNGSNDPRPGTPEERARANGGKDPLTGFSLKGTGQDGIHEILMQELMGLRGPVDPNDPRLKGQVDAFRNEQSRASQASRSALAERANFQGLPSGYVDAGIQSGIEDAGLETAKFQGELTQREYENKRAELDRLLQMAVSSSDSAAARALQAEISKLERDQQNSQFYDTMGYNVNRDQNNLDYLMAQLLMQGGA